MSRFDDLITGSVNLFLFLSFLFSSHRADVVRLYSFRTNVREREGGGGGGKSGREKKRGEDVDITFRYSFLRRVIIVA